MKGLIVTTDGFEDSEFSYPFYRLREAGFDVEWRRLMASR